MNPTAIAFWTACGFIGYGLNDIKTGAIAAGCAMVISIFLTMFQK